MTNARSRHARSALIPVVDGLEGRKLMSAGLGSLPHPAAEVHREATPASHHGHAAAVAPTVARWNWLANTCWYVPTNNVPAVALVGSNPAALKVVPVADQTVFHITGYREGYFWGISAAQLGGGSPGYSSMIGSVTPQGRVLLTFQSMDGASGTGVTEGIGQMVRKAGRWTMENQMFTGPGATSSGSLQIGHWAYMVPTHPGLPSWNSLPSVGESVPQFLSGAPGPGPTPIGS